MSRRAVPKANTGARSAEGSPASLPGRPKGEYRRAQHGGSPVTSAEATA